jgi:hypothetical protein
LIKSTISNLPTYYLSLFPIPIGVTRKTLEGLSFFILSFFFFFVGGGGVIGDELKFHSVKWSKICTPIISRGLGLKIFI